MKKGWLMGWLIFLAGLAVIAGYGTKILGLASNTVATATNDGKMPVLVRPEHAEIARLAIASYPDKAPMTEKTKFPWLGDRYYKFENGKIRIYSVGDVLLWTGSKIENLWIPAIGFWLLVILVPVAIYRESRGPKQLATRQRFM